MKKASWIEEIRLNDDPLGIPCQDVFQGVVKSWLVHCQKASLQLATLKGELSISCPLEDAPTNKWISTPTSNEQILSQATFRLPGHSFA